MLVPFLLRVLQIADQLSVSAVARCAERPGVRGSYYGREMSFRDFAMLAAWTVITVGFVVIGRRSA